jgi:hypothetical protein
MKRVSWKYLAGLIDGEGCIDVQVTRGVYVRPRLRLGMASNTLALLGLIQNSLGGHIEHRESKNPNWQDAVTLSWSGYRQACPILRNVVNHLFLKREQARFCLWLETNIKGKQVSTEVRDAIREELKLMKRDPHRLSEKAQERILQLL